MKGLLLSLLMVAGGPWSLSDCIQSALEHNISVQQSQITVEQRDIDLNTAQGRRLPGVSAGSSQNFSFGRGLTADNTYANTNTTNTSFTLGADIPVFQGLQISNSITLSKLNLAAATADLEKARDDIRVAVAQAYVQILYDKEILSVANNQILIDEQQVERLEAMAANGKASKAEVAAQKATLAQSKLTATQAENSLKMSILDLTQLLELPSPDGFDIAVVDARNLEPGLLMNPEDIYAEAVSVKPVVKSEELRLDYAETNIKLAKGGFYPSLSISGGLGSNFYTSSGFDYKPFGEQIRNNFSQYIGISLNIPVFSRFSVRNDVRSAQLNFKNQQLQLENVKKSLYKEIQQAYFSAVASQSKLEGSIEAAASAQESFTLVSAKYENGKANITEFNEAKDRLLEAESNLAQARYEHLYQSKLLDFYQGKDLVF